MKFVLAVHGTRGDVEPCAAVGVELRRRGHAVHMAVPPNLIEFVESAGLTGVAYGPDSDEQINTVAAFVRNLTRAQNPLNLARAVKELFVEGWAEMGTTLTTLADGADLVMTGQTYHGVAANVAEYYDIPAAALHHFPMQVNGQIAIPSIPTPATLVRATMKVSWRLYATSARMPIARNDVNWAYRQHRRRRCVGWRNAERPKSKPTTRFFSPDWRPNGATAARLSAR
ncbi:glycosyltransferase [Mycobacterium tuberculosis]|nr:glycosyltransferase [Mycobacterium tuberculosis]